MNDDPRIKILEGFITNLNARCKLNLEISLNLWRFVVLLKNNQNAMARRLADSPLFLGDEKAKQEFLGEVAKLESVCERLENTLESARELETVPPAPPAPGS